MANSFIYQCPSCKHQTTLRMGIGFVCPNPPEIETDIMNGLYGEAARNFLTEHPDHILNASLEIYQCRCGNIQNEYHIALKSDKVKTLYNRQYCNQCSSRMKLLTQPPERIACSECGSAMALDVAEEILWD